MKKLTFLAMLLVAVLSFNVVGVTAAAAVSEQDDPDYSIAQVTTAGETYTVQGMVVAENTRSVIITDGTTNVMIYGNGIADAVKIDDFIQVTAEASVYNNIIQLNYNSETPVTFPTPAQTPTETAIIPLTADIANGWRDKAAEDPSGLTVKDYQRYSWQAVANRSGSYWTLTPADMGLEFQIEPLYVDSGEFNLQAGVNYDVIAYFTGFNDTVSTPFAGTMIQKLTPVAEQLEIKVPKQYIAVQYRFGTTVDLGVTIENYKTTSAYTVTSSDTTVATWNDDNKILNLVGIGTATVTVTSEEDKAKSVNITVVAYRSALTAISELDEGTFMVTGTVVALTTSSAIISDGTAGVMVYDIKQVSTLKETDVVTVAGTLTEYNGLLQFSYNPGVVVEKTEETKPVPTESKELTEAKLASWQSATVLSQTDVELYHWTAVAGLRNSFNVYSLSYNGIAVESAEALENITLGTTYDIEGYFAGYNTNNDYASFVITKHEVAAQQQDYIGFNRDTINLGLNTTYTLSPFVGGTITADSVKYTVEDPTVVGLDEETKVITGLKAGTTKITASAGTITRTLTVNVDSSIGQITQSGQFYTVIGKVVAITEQSMVIHDGTDGILVFGRNAIAGVTKGQYVQVSGTISTYNNMLQFNNPTVDITEQTVPDGEITPLTASIADGWAAERTTPFPVSACQGYSWTATVEEKNGFLTINFGDSTTVIEPVYYPATATPQLEVGKTYNIVGYFVGYSTSNGYAAIAIESATLVS